MIGGAFEVYRPNSLHIARRKSDSLIIICRWQNWEYWTFSGQWLSGFDYEFIPLFDYLGIK